MDVGPERAGHFGLRAEVDWTEARKSATPSSADIREELVILECKDAFANIIPVQRQARQQRSCAEPLNPETLPSRPPSVVAVCSVWLWNIRYLLRLKLLA